MDAKRGFVPEIMRSVATNEQAPARKSKEVLPDAIEGKEIRILA